MQLKFNRSTYEKKGLFGSKNKYKLEALVDATPAEATFMNSGLWSIQWLALGNPFDKKAAENFYMGPDYKEFEFANVHTSTAGLLLHGLTIEADSAAEIQHAEKAIVAACKAIKNHCEVTGTFEGGGSEEIIDL